MSRICIRIAARVEEAIIYILYFFEYFGPYVVALARVPGSNVRPRHSVAQTDGQAAIVTTLSLLLRKKRTTTDEDEDRRTMLLLGRSRSPRLTSHN
jgi:hypothetical protein